MMIEFLRLNTDKLKFGLKSTSMLFTALVLIAFTWGFLKGQVPDWSLFITVVFFASVIFPLFIVTIGTIQEFQTYRKFKKLLDSYPFSELTKFGFEKVFANEESKWFMTQIKLKGHFNDYPMEGEMDKLEFKLIALVNLDAVSKDHLKQLRRELGDNKIDMDWLGIALKYNISKERVTSFEQIKNDLKQLTDYLKKERLQPLTLYQSHS